MMMALIQVNLVVYILVSRRSSACRFDVNIVTYSFSLAPQPPLVPNQASTTTTSTTTTTTTTTTADSSNSNSTADSPSTNTTDDAGDVNSETSAGASQPGRNGRPSRDGFLTFLRVQQYLATMTIAERSALSSPLSQFLLDCEYSGAYCYET